MFHDFPFSPVLDGPTGSTSQIPRYTELIPKKNLLLTNHPRIFDSATGSALDASQAFTNIDIIITLSMPSMPAPQVWSFSVTGSPQIDQMGLFRESHLVTSSNDPMYGCERRAFLQGSITIFPVFLCNCWGNFGGHAIYHTDAKIGIPPICPTKNWVLER